MSTNLDAALGRVSGVELDGDELRKIAATMLSIDSHSDAAALTHKGHRGVS